MEQKVDQHLLHYSLLFLSFLSLYHSLIISPGFHCSFSHYKMSCSLFPLSSGIFLWFAGFWGRWRFGNTSECEMITVSPEQKEIMNHCSFLYNDRARWAFEDSSWDSVITTRYTTSTITFLWNALLTHICYMVSVKIGTNNWLSCSCAARYYSGILTAWNVYTVWLATMLLHIDYMKLWGRSLLIDLILQCHNRELCMNDVVMRRVPSLCF